MRPLRPPFLLLLALLAFGCGGDGNPSSTSTGSSATPSAPAGEQGAPARDAALRAGAAEPASGPEPTTSVSSSSLEARKLIRTGKATVEVDSLEPAMDAIRTQVRAVDGFVAGTQIRSGTHRFREATLTLRVPSAQFEPLLEGLDPLGDLQALDTSTRDVTDRVVDLEARRSNQRRLEERLLGLLEERTGELDDVLRAERELARVREEIERMTARLRALEDQVALSTLTVTLREPRPVVTGETPEKGPLARALERSWENFVRTVAGLIEAAGWFVPVLLVVGALLLAFGLLVRAAWRRRRSGET